MSSDCHFLVVLLDQSTDLHMLLPFLLDEPADFFAFHPHDLTALPRDLQETDPMTAPEAASSFRLLPALYLEDDEVPNLGLPDVDELPRLWYVNDKSAMMILNFLSPYWSMHCCRRTWWLPRGFPEGPTPASLLKGFGSTVHRDLPPSELQALLQPCSVSQKAVTKSSMPQCAPAT